MNIVSKYLKFGRLVKIEWSKTHCLAQVKIIKLISFFIISEENCERIIIKNIENFINKSY